MKEKVELVEFMAIVYFLEKDKTLFSINTCFGNSYGREFLKVSIDIENQYSDEHPISEHQQKNKELFQGVCYTKTVSDSRNSKPLTEEILNSLSFLLYELVLFKQSSYFVIDNFSKGISKFINDERDNLIEVSKEKTRQEIEKVQYEKLDKYIQNASQQRLKDISKRRKDYKTYLIKCNNTQLIKIGKSCDPKVREKTLQSENPNQVLIFIIKKDVESILHEHYKEKRVRGEWFKLDDSDIKLIRVRYEKNSYPI